MQRQFYLDWQYFLNALEFGTIFTPLTYFPYPTSVSDYFSARKFQNPNMHLQKSAEELFLALDDCVA